MAKKVTKKVAKAKKVPDRFGDHGLEFIRVRDKDGKIIRKPGSSK